MNKTGLLVMLLAALFVLAGCTSFTATPSRIDFQGFSWDVSSAEIVDEFGGVRPASASDQLLVVTLNIRGDSYPPKSQNMTLASAFFGIALQEPNTPLNNLEIGYTEDGMSINEVVCIFAVPRGTRSVEIVFPNSQIIKITVRR